MREREFNELLLKHMERTDRSIYNIYKILNGNGQTGLNVMVDRNTGFRRNINKLLWFLITPLYIGLVAIIIKTIIGN